VADSVLHEEESLASADGTRLRLLSWAPEGAAKAHALVVPGFADHAGRYREVGHAFAKQGIKTFVIDLRGHGGSGGKRGHVGAWEDYLADVDAAAAAIDSSKFFLLGHSMGGLIALDWLSERGPDRLAGLILTNPFLDVAAPVPPLKLKLGEIAARFLPAISFPTGLRPEDMSRDTSIAEGYRRDPMVFTTGTAGWYAHVQQAQARVRALREVPVPLLYVYSDADRVVSWRASAELSGQLRAKDKTVWVRPGEYHEVLNELDRARLHAQVAEWMSSRA
jgi:lysophospholipase